MKIIPALLIICLLVVGISLISTGCNNDPPPPENKQNDPPPPPENKQWESQVSNWKKEGYHVLNVDETTAWLIKNPTITMDNNWFMDLGFLEQKRVEEGSTIITRDHNGNLRVATKNQRQLNGWQLLSTKASIKWLEAKGYTVKKNDDGYTLEKDGSVTRIGWGVKTVIEGVGITTDSGTIRIMINNTQQ